MQFGNQSKKQSSVVDLTQGSIVKGILYFAIPLFFGQLLQSLYNLADAWVVGNFADNDAFAAVSSSGNITFLIIGFCNGLSVGGGVIISKFYGAKDEVNVSKAVHTNILMGLISSVIATVLGFLLIPTILSWMNVPESVLPDALTYFNIYFGGVITVVMYNIFMSIMRAMGDSKRPLYYLAVSSVANVILDLIFVAWLHQGVAGAAIATVFSQGLSAALCLARMIRTQAYTKLEWQKLFHYEKDIMKAVMLQGLPSGVQNSVVSIGNIVIQANINIFGAYAMSGHGAYARLEGIAFMPIMCMSMALPTFISQNIGAAKYDRAKKGAVFGIISGVVMAELVGFALLVFGRPALSFFISDLEAVDFGMKHIAIQPLFFFLLAFSHCAAGALRGLGKSVIPMFAMLSSWCAFRIVYVTIAVHFIPKYEMICWAYPITWSLTTIIFLISILRVKWNKVDF